MTRKPREERQPGDGDAPSRACCCCGSPVTEHRVYFGVVGPFCDVACRDEYVSAPGESSGSLCPNCELTTHARCCSWCGKVHGKQLLDQEQCSAECARAAADADRFSAALEES